MDRHGSAAPQSKERVIAREITGPAKDVFEKGIREVRGLKGSVVPPIGVEPNLREEITVAGWWWLFLKALISRNYLAMLSLIVLRNRFL